MKRARPIVNAEIAIAIALQAFSLMHPTKYTITDPTTGAKIIKERIILSTQIRKKSTTTISANRPRAKMVT